MLKMHTSCVSHDIKAPAKAITTVIEILLSMENVDEEVLAMLRPVRCASKILSFQIYNLLDYNLLQKNLFAFVFYFN